MSLSKVVKFMLLMTLLTSVIQVESAYAKSFDRGYSLFKKRKYRQAKKHLSRSLRETRDRYDKALIYKLLGITEYEIGSKRKGNAYFKKAVKLDPSLGISRKDTKNRRIIAAFKKAKSSSGGRNRFRSARRSNRSEGQSDAGLLAFAPFGVGQFVQGKTLIGSALAAGQAAALFYYFDRDSAAKAADSEAISVINEQESSGGTFYSEDEFLAYLDANEQFVLAARQEAQMGIFLFLGLYGAGVAEAILFPPSSGKSSRRRRSAVESAQQNLADNEVLESIYLSPKVTEKKEWDLQLLPSTKGAVGQVTWTKAL